MSSLIRRDVLASIGGFDESLTTSDVYDLLIRLHRAGHRMLHYTDSPLYIKCLSRGDNLSRSKTATELIAERERLLYKSQVNMIPRYNASSKENIK